MPETLLAQKLSTVGFFLRPLWSFVANYKLIPLSLSGLHIPLLYVQPRLKNKYNYNLPGTLRLLDCTEVTPQILSHFTEQGKCLSHSGLWMDTIVEAIVAASQRAYRWPGDP